MEKKNAPEQKNEAKKQFKGFVIKGGVQQESGQLGASACCNKC